MYTNCCILKVVYTPPTCPCIEHPDRILYTILLFNKINSCSKVINITSLLYYVDENCLYFKFKKKKKGMTYQLIDEVV